MCLCVSVFVRVIPNGIYISYRDSLVIIVDVVV